MATHAYPKKNTHIGNICGFCKYMEKDIKLKNLSVGGVEFDDTIRCRCLAVSGIEFNPPTRPACPKFELSYEANRYAK